MTGASRGIGKGLVETVPWSVARVIGVSRSPGPAAVHLEADLSRPAGWDMLEASFHRELAGFRGERVVFIHAAAMIDPVGFVGRTEPGLYRANVILNAAAPLILGEAFLRAVRGMNVRRQLVLLSSSAARRTRPGLATYGAAKAAVDSWVRTVGEEQSSVGGVQVLSVAPGRVATDMQAHMRAAGEGQLPDRAQFIRMHKEGWLRDPIEVAKQLWSLVLDADILPGSVLDLSEPPTNDVGTIVKADPKGERFSC